MIYDETRGVLKNRLTNVSCAVENGCVQADRIDHQRMLHGAGVSGPQNCYRDGRYLRPQPGKTNISHLWNYTNKTRSVILSMVSGQLMEAVGRKRPDICA